MRSEAMSTFRKDDTDESIAVLPSGYPLDVAQHPDIGLTATPEAPIIHDCVPMPAAGHLQPCRRYLRDSAVEAVVTTGLVQPVVGAVEQAHVRCITFDDELHNRACRLMV